MRKREKIALLKRTQKLLQAGHDYIECNGFNIMAYGYGGGSRCFIGTVRTVAGMEETAPPHDNAARINDYRPDVNEEVQCALDELDAAVKDKLKKHYISEAEKFDVKSGRYVEQFGFMKNDKGMKDENQHALALKVFRMALTNVHNELEALKA